MKKLRHHLETASLSVAAWLLPRLPRRLVLALAKGLGNLAYYLDARGRHCAQANLKCAFGGQFSSTEIQRIARGSYQNFARTFLDLFWAQRLTPANWESHVSIQLDDPTAEATARAKGAVWVTPHFGNFEFVSLIWGFRGVPFTVVAQNFKNPALTQLFKGLREHTGHEVIPQEQAMLRLMKALKNRGHAGLLTDLNIKPGRAATVIDCFGPKTCVPTLHVELAKRLGLAIITGVCLPKPEGRYEVRIFEAIQPSAQEDTQALTQRIWNRFEEIIRQYPEYWIWMYKHWRYLPTPERDASYPDYANPSPAFCELIERARLPQVQIQNRG